MTNSKNIPQAIKKTMALANPMQLVDEAGLEQLLEIADGNQADCLELLAELKPYIKHHEPKPVLAALKVLEEMMSSASPQFQQCVATEEWMRRLGKLVYNSDEPILKMTVLQLLGTWQHQFASTDQSMVHLTEKCAELTRKGHAIPTPQPRAHSFEDRIRTLTNESLSNELVLCVAGMTELRLLVLASDQAGVLQVLTILKSTVEDNLPQRSLIGLKILQQLMQRDANLLFHQHVATEEWLKRLVRLHDCEEASDSLKQIVLQLLVEMREQLTDKPKELSRVARTCAQLFAAGVTLPSTSHSSPPVKTWATEVSIAPLYTGYDADNFGSVRWTEEHLELTTGNNNRVSVWNPLSVVRCTDRPAFLQKLADVGVKGPPATCVATEEELESFSGCATRLKQSEQYWKNKAVALQKKIQLAATAGKVQVGTGQYSGDATRDGSGRQLDRFAEQMQQQLRTMHAAQAETIEGRATLLHSELVDAKTQNGVLVSKLKTVQLSNEALEQQCAKQEAVAHKETKDLFDKLRVADIERTQADAQIADLKAVIENNSREAKAGDHSDAAGLQCALETLQLEFNAAERRYDELELAFGMAKAEKEQLQSRVSKVAGSCFQSKAIKARSAANELRSEQARLRAYAGESLGQMSTALATVESTLVQQLCLSETIVNGAVREREELRSMYKSEMKKRKELYNSLQELRGNLRVYCRMRPLTSGEFKAQDGKDFFSVSESGDQLRVTERNSKGVGKRIFGFDEVLGADSTQQQVYNTVAPLISSALDGYNVCIFAYGQTGSGKTFTMEGDSATGQNAGISKRAVSDIFAQMEERTADETIEVRLSMLEVYKEQIFDLLAAKKGQKLDKLKLDKSLGVVVEGLTEERVSSATQVQDAVSRGQKMRTVASTAMNDQSSRSHLVLRLCIQCTDRISGDVTHAKLSLVDLAGSERLDKSKAGDEDETKSINGSLSALGNVVRALANKSKHVPYRDSKLTRILEDSIGGDAKTLMFANINPAEMHIPETLCTLKFAVQAKSVATGAIKKNVTKGEKK